MTPPHAADSAPTRSSDAQQQQQSSFAASHPDHPVLSDLHKTPEKSGSGEADPTSPDMTTTPQSMSDASVSPPPGAPGPDPSAPGASSASFSSHHGTTSHPEPHHAHHHHGGHQRQGEVIGAGGGGGGAAEVLRRPGGLGDNPNARSKTITMAEGENTFGALNRHPAPPAGNTSHASSGLAYRVGVSEDRNRKCRRTMEDSHSFVYDFGGVKGQGYFAVFDGHAGKHAAEWCGQNFHEWLLDCLIENPDAPVPDSLNTTFHKVDSRLSRLASQDNTHSGCTAVTAFLRLEEVDTGRGFLNPAFKSRGLMDGKGEEELERLTSARRSAAGGGGADGKDGASVSSGASTSEGSSIQRKSSGKRIKAFVKGLTGSRDKETPSPEEPQLEVVPGPVGDNDDPNSMTIADGRTPVDLIEAKSDKGVRRVLYTANVGDARAVLCRGGKAVRLTYDHKGSDAQEAKRITDAGGFVMNNRVNGVLAVTRSLGDSSMKEFVVGSPYTTETALDEDDEFLIVACDGLWDVTEDQDAVDLIRAQTDPQKASKLLLDFAIHNYSTDNLSVMVVRFKGF